VDYAKLIKKLREKLILSQSELASILDVSFSSVNRWENGKHEPTIKVKRKIVEICKGNNIKIDDNEGEH
jgi:DNA-binding XRE family transcriptional regulator